MMEYLFNRCKFSPSWKYFITESIHSVFDLFSNGGIGSASKLGCDAISAIRFSSVYHNIQKQLLSNGSLSYKQMGVVVRVLNKMNYHKK